MLKSTRVCHPWEVNWCYIMKSLKTVSFLFLISTIPGRKSKIQRHFALAYWALGHLRKQIWLCNDISIQLNIRLFRCLTIPVLIYNEETWTLRIEDERTHKVFKMRCLQNTLGISRIKRVHNKLIRKLIGMEEVLVTKIIKSRLIINKKAHWYGRGGSH